MEINKCRMEASEDPDNFFVRLDNMNARLKTLKDEPYSDVKLYVMLLEKLPPNYKEVRTFMELQTNPLPTYSEAKAHVRAYWARNFKNARKQDDGIKALNVKHNGRRRRGPLPQHKDLTCHRCGEKGHISPDCTKEKEEGSGNGSTHYRKPLKKSWKGKPHSRTPTTSNDSSPSTDKANTARTDEWAFMAEKVPVESSLPSHKLSWIVDSGATSHMVCSRDDLVSFKPGDGRVIVAGGRVLNSTGVGVAQGTVKTVDGRILRITFHEVLLVPGLGSNLLSVQRISAKGGKVVFTPNNSYLEMHNTKVPLSATYNLYQLDYWFSRNAKPMEQAYSATGS